MPKSITVDGKKYKVTEQPCYHGSIGCQAAMVEVDGKDKFIVKQGKWRFWTPLDRTAPLRAALAAGTWPVKR